MLSCYSEEVGGLEQCARELRRRRAVVPDLSYCGEREAKRQSVIEEVLEQAAERACVLNARARFRRSSCNTSKQVGRSPVFK